MQFSMRASARAIAFAAVFACVSLSARGPKPLINVSGGEIAIKGYDVVEYWNGHAMKGSPEYTYRWSGAVWQFASAANRARFVKSPAKYVPRFGGYCAWAISRGYTADVDPESFEIVGGHLYLIYSKSVQLRWDQDVAGNIAKAEANWPAVLNK